MAQVRAPLRFPYHSLYGKQWVEKLRVPPYYSMKAAPMTWSWQDRHSFGRRERKVYSTSLHTFTGCKLAELESQYLH